MKKIFKQTMKFIDEKKSKIEMVYMTLIIFIGMNMATVMPVYASADQITKPIDNLKTLMFGVISAIGAIVLGKNIMEFATSYQQNDSSGMNSALKGIVSGILMVGISVVVSILNVTK